MYLLKLSLRPWRRSPYSQVFTSIAVGVLLFLAGFLYWMQSSLSPVIDRLQNEQVITAYLDPALEPKDEPQIVDSIRTTLGAHEVAQPADVELVQPDQFINHLRGEYPELRARAGGSRLRDANRDSALCFHFRNSSAECGR